ncbi:2,3-dihydro-2,3-dihydroxybenzoate dehydrogenase [Streptomonospora nanhaiensis]|uniref:2,3-dihydro-2,3-dihydroxybenzoate dehydrogenase n=1 Tax=Streptomonospora nanhaiensis TaxID=1323731 RepID=A0A853BH88_9ACTN|nr:2,3-dihydro-2,3-dihydroxybenzoate dehydrogenase [Streptomonospora nanhaiensis]MBV2363779.1 2,3-dihydro-2,3-dihydroxybenzoate dehydrogenase [Streptomonospora nanhaiensis]MBX9388544.1 2,3-dihydro-2,3-dihydroxybenzoate dehydrogenase [Streptomonospora nanhaiensis]NYI93917.1 2,3-dihydro-2,3-dihydroxybenzoate dehydrogenase [Streptomonospora nanhaiensis]
MSHNGIEGTVALVTGAAQGIGRAVAVRLADAGATVAAVDRDPEGAADTADALRAAGHKAAAYVADVRDSAAVDALVDSVERDLGPIAHAVNVAGVLRTGPVTATGDADWAELFAVNATGVFHVSRAAARRMAGRGSGSIVTVGSNAAGVPRADLAAYGASKAAAAMFTKSLGLELARYGVRCNVVSPGSTDTPMQRGMWSGPDGAARVIAGDPGSFRTGIPLGRIADPADIADAVCFLASASARHITMHDLYVDGGATLRA